MAGTAEAHDEAVLASEARRLARRILRANTSPARLAYGTPRIALSYPAASDGGTDSSGEAMPLREARKRCGVSVDALARCSGVSVSTIHRIEHGETMPRPRVVRALSATLGVAPWQIAEFEPVLTTVGLRRPTVLAP